MTARRPLAVLLALFLVAATARAQPDPADTPGETVPIFDDLGTLHRAISSRSAMAQRYFDQGLRLTYAFNHDEAVNSFRRATQLDPECAMCYWGIALALGPNINLPMQEPAVRPAFEAAREALRRADRATPVERALIEALARRYEPGNQRRAALDSAYATAMRGVFQRFPEDPDVATLYADALMNLSPWDYWLPNDQPRPGTGEIVGALERTVLRHPDHPGACHLYIHAVEKPMPERAVPCAERLAQLMPGAGHLVHMPAHIYMRVGRYADAIRANQHATHADARYVSDRRPQGVYVLGYVPHNFHFLWAAAAMAGRSAEALSAARSVVEKAPLDAVRQIPMLEGFLPTPYLALARFGRWDELLREPAPPADLRFTTGMWHHARGLALAAKGRFAEAGAEAEKLRAITAAVPADQVVGINSTRSVLQVAQHVLAGQLAARQRRFDEAARELEAAVTLEDALRYEEPPAWYLPVRQVLGSVYLAAGRPADAEAAYREELRRNPNNGWSLFGLARSLRAQRRGEEAAEVEGRFRAAWKDADVTLTASTF